VKTNEAGQLRERVIKSSGDNYNHIRALIAQAQRQVAAKGATAVSEREAKQLVIAYSYLHGQRMTSLFDTCHEVLWRVQSALGRWNVILRLFRHSSFLWRIYGRLSNEQKYVDELSKTKLEAVSSGNGFTSTDFAYYQVRRLEASEEASRSDPEASTAAPV